MTFVALSGMKEVESLRIDSYETWCLPGSYLQTCFTEGGRTLGHARPVAASDR